MRHRTAIICLATLFLASCSSYEINHDYDVEAPFAEYHTYDWMPARPDTAASGADAALTHNALLDRRVRDAVDASLAEKGFARDTTHPDLLVAYHAGIKDRMDITDWGYDYSGDYSGWVGRDIDVLNYSEGTLLVDLLSAESGNLVWRGIATGALETGRSPETRERTIHEAVAKMFRGYPPRR
ncbi:MAG TPA: DUF4136 domain-containing protein [Candidatus Krumholzibacteria bacterium]|nr:DUF4136 domain-containing protein [Candidatus Krumholzibacteria bacterium]